MFTKTSDLYDLIYSFKDYAAESATVASILRERGIPAGGSLLDVACGTGKHLEHLQAAGYTVEGLDLDSGLLDVARKRCPGVPLHQADMVNFELGRRYDAITCLFSAIGYAVTISRLNQTLLTFARHLSPGGVIVIEPWFLPETFLGGHIHMLVVDQPDLKLARMSISRIEAGAENPVTPLDFKYQMATLEGITRFDEHHDIGLFTTDQYAAAITAAGLTPIFEAPGLTDRGLWLATP